LRRRMGPRGKLKKGKESTTDRNWEITERGHSKITEHTKVKKEGKLQNPWTKGRMIICVVVEKRRKNELAGLKRAALSRESRLKGGKSLERQTKRKAKD